MMNPDTLPAAAIPAAELATHDSGHAIARLGGLVLAEAMAVALAFVVIQPLAQGTPTAAFVAAGMTVFAARAISGLLPGRGLHPHEITRRSLLCTLIAIAICVGLPAIQGQPAYGRDIALFLILALPLQHLGRILAVRLLHMAALWTVPLHVIAEPDLRQAIEAFFRRNWTYGLTPDGGRGASVALVADGSQTATGAVADSYRQVFLLADIPHLRIAGLRPSDVGGAIGLRVTPVRSGLATASLKRAMDLAIAVPMLVVTLPIMALAAGAIWVVDPGPVFYRQPREGKDGTVLGVLKLRTMYCDAELILQDLLRADPAACAEWATHFKLKRDPRILPFIGKFLRRSSCDELPQLLNVIAGSMSLVGPRPFPVYHLEAMRPQFRRKRCTVPPGITGLWQISERSEADVAQQEQLDDFYIDNRSIWLDLSILLRTIPAVLLGRGAC